MDGKREEKRAYLERCPCAHSLPLSLSPPHHIYISRKPSTRQAKGNLIDHSVPRPTVLKCQKQSNRIHRLLRVPLSLPHTLNQKSIWKDSREERGKNQSGIGVWRWPQQWKKRSTSMVEQRQPDSACGHSVNAQQTSCSP